MAAAFSRILLAYDASPGARIALDYACALARRGATLVVVHAVDEARLLATATSGAGYVPIDPAPVIDAVNAAAAVTIAAAVDACTADGARAEHVFLHDDPATGIADLVRSRAIDLIVCGTHGRQGIARIAFGSVAYDIVTSCGVPVLVANAHTRSPRRDPLFARALVALDDSESAQRCLAVAMRLYDDFTNELVLCTVIDTHDLMQKGALYGYDPFPIAADMRSAATALLTGRAAAAGLGVGPESLVVAEGAPAEQIEMTAIHHNCDLIVTGTHGRRGLSRIFRGSVAEHIGATSSLPALIVPDPR